MPYGTDAGVLKSAVRSFASKTFSDYHYVMALHQDTQDRETFMQKRIADIAHKRINGESLQSSIPAQETDSVHKSKHKDKNKDYEI